jgi:hypothetical protein
VLFRVRRVGVVSVRGIVRSRIFQGIFKKSTWPNRQSVKEAIPGVGCRVDARGYISPQTKRSRSVQ